MIDFESPETHFLFNPRLADREKQWLESAKNSAVGSDKAVQTKPFPKLRGHIWLASSGTTGAGSGAPSADALKVIALSKRAFLVAAAGANTYLRSMSTDVWLNPLPNFHVGGLSIYARASLTGAKVVVPPSAKWNVQEFVSLCEKEKITLASLVPTQVYDLVVAKLKAPKPVRAVLVGGSALSPQLYAQASELGWPLLPTYGMTEVCSQIATGAPEATILGHIEARVSETGLLQIRSEALFTEMGYVNADGYQVLFSGDDALTSGGLSDGWYTTNDFCEIEKKNGRRLLRFVGRAHDLIKVGGELVNLAKLKSRFEEFMRARNSDIPFEYVFIADEHDRLGQIVSVATGVSGAIKAAELFEEFNSELAPFERVRRVFAFQSLPKSDLGKIKIGEIRDFIS